MSYIDIVIYIRPLPYLKTWPPIYRGQERMVRDRLKASQVLYHVAVAVAAVAAAAAVAVAVDFYQ
jgi:hypothetical protein